MGTVQRSGAEMPTRIERLSTDARLIYSSTRSYNFWTLTLTQLETLTTIRLFQKKVKNERLSKQKKDGQLAAPGKRRPGIPYHVHLSQAQAQASERLVATTERKGKIHRPFEPLVRTSSNPQKSIPAESRTLPGAVAAVGRRWWPQTVFNAPSIRSLIHGP